MKMAAVERGSRRHEGKERDYYDSSNSKYDDPPHSRLFIVCGKSLTEDDFRESFSKFGVIEEVWVVKDRNTDEPKGVTYIKFSKTSEAALAMEEMNGRCIGDNPRPLKVLIAHSRDQGSKRESNEEERLLRLFVVVPKTMVESDLREHFKQFGDIDYVSIVKDRNTKESKGFAYVKYQRMSHTAKAFEGCDRSFKPVFADPKPARSDSSRFDMGRDHRDFRNGDTFGGAYNGGTAVPPSLQNSNTSNFHHHFSASSPFLKFLCLDSSGLDPEGVTRLSVIASGTLNQDQLWKLFDLIPGLDYCDFRKDRKVGQGRGVATVQYNNVQSAAYAKEKLHGFEYPPGERLIVKYDRPHDMTLNAASPYSVLNRGVAAPYTTHNGPLTSTPGGPEPFPVPALSAARPSQDLAAQLAETLAQATSIIQAAGLSQNSSLASASPNQTTQSTGETYDPYYCSVKLPPPQPLAPVDSAVAERLFIVCQPHPPQIFALKDVFGRFGSLIDIYMLSGKSFGYAKYADKDCADKAIATLHGQEILGSRLRVMTADPHDKSDSARKRLKLDQQN